MYASFTEFVKSVATHLEKSLYLNQRKDVDHVERTGTTSNSNSIHSYEYTHTNTDISFQHPRVHIPKFITGILSKMPCPRNIRRTI